MELPNADLHSSELSHINAMDSQILSSHSLSMPSEPPEITNWFPSYHYESPATETGDVSKDINAEEIEIGIGKEKLFINDRESAKPGIVQSSKIEKDDQKSLIDSIDSPSLPSLDSEPIHVENWFSSYEYESPALDTSDGLLDSAYKHEGHEFRIEDITTRKEGSNDDVRKRNDAENAEALVDYRNSCGDIEQEKQSLSKADFRSGAESQVLSGKSTTCLGSVLKRGSKYAELQNPEIICTSEDSRCTLNFSEMSSCKPGCEKDDKSVMIDKLSVSLSVQRSDSKENDGFVTTRKGGVSNEREEIHLEKRKGNGKETNYVTERTVLAERTNSQPPFVTGITGKWKCPQKRKPDLGPPLKQLRLERWVHRL